MQFGMDICMQAAWFELSLLRTSSMQAVKGGLSAFFVAMFRLFFDKHDVITKGVISPSVLLW